MGLTLSTQQRIASLAKRFGGLLVNGIGKSLRLEIRGLERVLHLVKTKQPIVFQFWHGDMFIAWYITSAFQPAAIVSQAGDGDIASAVLEGLDYVTFRGSSTRGGRRAFSGMIRYLKMQEFKVSAFASDGPKGPRYEMKAGTYVTAQHLDGFIIPVASTSKWSLRAKGWDKFFIPLPFSKAVLSFGDPIKAKPGLKSAALDKELKYVSEICKRHQEGLNRAYLQGEE
ncbi:MAG: DUF374 domain-containing protein [Candidatus Marinimicrobia bacterium]|nr:DUF374 domain-containing protein [Candidatus Neomarinimicrobiota bacterium]MCF7903768.1 DUF374 domain-containing protein [Candidatus Neomarinimicrobiota bacterium]